MEAAPERDQVREVVAANLRSLKAIRRVSDKQIGVAIGLSGSAVNERMRGVAHCTASDLVAFARYFGVEVADLIYPTAHNPRYENGISVVTPLLGQMELPGLDNAIVSRDFELVKT